MGLSDQVEVPKPLRFVLNWGRKYSLWVYNFGLACCAIEFIAASTARHDFIRFGVIPFAHAPRQADVMIVAGTLTKGVDQIIPVDVYVHGCPPRPEALLEGIVHLQELIGNESLKDRYAERDARQPIVVGGGDPTRHPLSDPM